MRKHNNLKMAEQFFDLHQAGRHMTWFEARMYYYLFKWAGYRE